MGSKQWRLVTNIVAIILPICIGSFISVVMIEFEVSCVVAVLVGQLIGVLFARWLVKGEWNRGRKC